ncbi:MAG: YeeE/YedE thiosulfate transporter family protein [Clostridium sp.]|nr:YeeE/YedE thiosulfate transporter family protein [Clostridium sp.]
MKKNTWMKGALILGFSFFIAIFLVKPIGVSTQFSVLSGIIHSSIDKNVIVTDPSRESGYSSTNAYYDKNEGKLAEEIKKPLNYSNVFVLSIPVGSLLGYALLRKKTANRKIDEEVENCEIGKNKPILSTYVIPFVGGFILLFGARMADGCTSGHMMSGIMQGSVSGYVFAGAVFATAIPTAIIVKKFKDRRA